jgi:hypothetical protein
MLIAVLALAAGLSSQAADNVDPANDGSQYAWGENVGWINAEPSGDGGPGMLLEDFRVSGWLWGENIGWISLTCENTGSCESIPYSVRNDGIGALSGNAWAENTGWINFAPYNAGVFADRVSGELSGHAWGENIGWISFQSAGANPHVLRTGWTCEPPPPAPVGPYDVVLMRAAPSVVEMFWNPVPGATGYDVVFGELNALRNDPNRYLAATLGCTGENVTGTAAAFDGNPPPGDGFWFLVRGTHCGDSGSYDSGGPHQMEPRDPGIATSTADCAVP